MNRQKHRCRKKLSFYRTTQQWSWTVQRVICLACGQPNFYSLNHSPLNTVKTAPRAEPEGLSTEYCLVSCKQHVLVRARTYAYARAHPTSQKIARAELEHRCPKPSFSIDSGNGFLPPRWSCTLFLPFFQKTRAPSQCYFHFMWNVMIMLFELISINQLKMSLVNLFGKHWAFFWQYMKCLTSQSNTVVLI